MKPSGLLLPAILLVILGGLLFLVIPVNQPALEQTAAPLVATDQFEISAHASLVNTYCVACHNATLQTGGLTLDDHDLTAVTESPEVWEKVLRKLRANAMPPTGMPRPSAEEFEGFVAYLETSLDRQAETRPSPGRTLAFNRLNRTQYQNAVRDLLALDVNVADFLPKDDVSYGFDNVNLSTLSPTLMERYLATAQKISRLAVGTPLQNPLTHVQLVPPDRTQEDRFEGLPFGTRGGTAFDYFFPRDGEYQIDVLLTRDRNENIEGLTEPHDMEITLDGERLALFEIVPNRSEIFAEFYYHDQGAGEGLQTRLTTTAGTHRIAVTFLRKNAALIESTRQPYIAHFNRDRHPRQQPAVHSVAVAGPYEDRGISTTPSRERIFSCFPGDGLSAEACGGQIIARLARQAFRRPVDAADLEKPLAFFREVQAEQGFEAGIEMALRALLVSPEFLFRIERDPPDLQAGDVYRVSDVELASRLSFFLWSSIPDAELLALAEAGRLRDTEVLSAQVTRMLADPRAESLASDFLSQWLYLRNLDAVDPNSRLFPDFDDNLRQAMLRETELLFMDIVQQDRSVMTLLNADHTFLNERLARHYGIANVYGDHFRQVALPPDSVRPGLLGHGSVLTVTSYATRTSPVQRGKWVLENILGIPPPPPPDDVPNLEENRSEVRVLTMRDRMAQHRANPACAQCHQVMDPIGLVMENFDAIGRWRQNNSDHEPIDATGHLPGGASLEGVTGLRQALAGNTEAFVGTMTEKLLTFALGRGLTYNDGPAVRAIVAEAAENNYRFHTLVHALVSSTPFQMRSIQ